MASYFNLRLDTTAPSGLALIINSGASYTTSTAVALGISVSDQDTTGYQMLIWGISGAADEASATWETFAATKNVTLPSGDGSKTVHIKVRDAVGNACAAANASITLDTAVPAVSITGPDVSVVSKVVSFDTAAFSFQSDQAFVEYKVKVVPATSSLEGAGTVIGTANGSNNMSNIGTFAANTAINCTIKGADLESASAGDGTKIVKVFVKNAAGTWSNA